MAYNSLYNNKYTKAVEIYNRIAARYPNRQIDLTNIIEWCAECETQEIKTAPEWFLYKDLKIAMTDHSGLTPCNIYRLLDVTDSNQNRIKYYYDGSYIRVPSDKFYDYVCISYYGLPIDEDARPLIVKGHEKACEYYCLKMIYEPEYMEGKINGQQWDYILNQYSEGLMLAHSNFRNLSRNEIEEMSRIQYNMIQKVGYVPRYNLD